MGFGTLFIGTVLTINIAAHGYTDFFAYLLFFASLLRLREYHPKMKPAFLAVFPLLFAGGCELVLSLTDLLGLYQNDRLMGRAYLVNQITLYIVTALLLRGIAALAMDTDVPSLRVRAFRNQIFALIYHGCMIFLNITTTSNAIAAVQQTLLLPVMLFGLVYLVLQAKLIFSCYMWICPEEDAGMEQNPSRCSLFNKWRAFDNRMDDHTAARVAEERRLRQDRTKNRDKSKNNKNKSKKQDQ